jgi:hypothetical protein
MTNRHAFAVMFGLAVALACLTPRAFTSAERFYADDPQAREPETQDASGAHPWDIGLFYELAHNLFVVPRNSAANVRAGDVNTVDEVPDSSWFTNRIGARPMTDAQLIRGPNFGPAPAPERWVILREKTAGVHPGFTARDANGETWFLSFDDPAYPEGATAAAVIATKLFWALGYNQVETFITVFDPARTVIDPSATKRRPSGARTSFTRGDLDEVLERAVRSENGTYRAVAGRILPGKVLGGFRYAGTRPDDPNDVVPHEHRRSLRALRVFGAWANLTDLKAGNTLDTLVSENGRGIVKHVLQDVGSAFGMANGRYEWDIGWEHFYDPTPSRRRLASFGFKLSPWQTVPYREYPSIGRIEADEFDPTAWKPQTPTEAYMQLCADDAFWAARRVMAFSDELIRAAVHTGAYTDTAGEQHLATVLIGRRNAVGRAYLTTINPIVTPQVDAAGTLTFENAAVASRLAEPPQEYRAQWSLFDNATGSTQPIGETQSSTMKIPPPRDLPRGTGAFIEIDISALSDASPSWQKPVRTFFRRTDQGWSLVGLERLR